MPSQAVAAARAPMAPKTQEQLDLIAKASEKMQEAKALAASQKPTASLEVDVRVKADALATLHEILALVELANAGRAGRAGAAGAAATLTLLEALESLAGAQDALYTTLTPKASAEAALEAIRAGGEGEATRKAAAHLEHARAAAAVNVRRWELTWELKSRNQDEASLRKAVELRSTIQNCHEEAQRHMAQLAP